MPRAPGPPSLNAAARRGKSPVRASPGVRPHTTSSARLYVADPGPPQRAQSPAALRRNNNDDSEEYDAFQIHPDLEEPGFNRPQGRRSARPSSSPVQAGSVAAVGTRAALERSPPPATRPKSQGAMVTSRPVSSSSSRPGSRASTTRRGSRASVMFTQMTSKFAHLDSLGGDELLSELGVALDPTSSGVQQTLLSWVLRVASVVVPAALIAIAAGMWHGDPLELFKRQQDALNTMTPDDALAVVGKMCQVQVAVLSIVLSVTAITVQLAASNFSHLVAQFVTQDPTIRFYLVWYSMSIVVVVSVYYTTADRVWTAGILAAESLTVACLCLLLTFFAYVFDYLNPRYINQIVTDHAVEIIGSRAKLTEHTDVVSKQLQLVEAVNNLGVMGLKFIDDKRKMLALSIFNSLFSIATGYRIEKKDLEQAWFDISSWAGDSPDFISENEDICAKGVWVEWLVLRQYEMLFRNSIGSMPQLCFIVAINTRKLLEISVMRKDYAVVTLCIKYFNTYLSALILGGGVLHGPSIMTQYRKACIFLLHRLEASRTEEDVAFFRTATTDIFHYVRYYVNLTAKTGAVFLMEIMCHDIGELCEYACLLNSQVHDELLDIFLTYDDHIATTGKKHLICGVRRAQVKLAISYLLHQRPEYAQEVREDFEQTEGLLKELYSEVLALNKAEFWEVSDRPTNIYYLSAAHLAMLPQFFGLIDGRADIDEDVTNATPDVRSTLFAFNRPGTVPDPLAAIDTLRAKMSATPDIRKEVLGTSSLKGASATTVRDAQGKRLTKVNPWVSSPPVASMSAPPGPGGVPGSPQSPMPGGRVTKKNA